MNADKTPMPEEPVVSEEQQAKPKRGPGARISAFWRMERIRNPRRRFLARAAVVLAILAIFVLIPGYLAQQPQFVQRYANLSPEYHTWSTSVHAQVPCQRCHVAPQPVPQTVYAVRMLGEFYLSLAMPNRRPQLYEKPVNDACQSCHVDLRTVSPSGDLNIPHRAHVDLLKMKCIQCHRYLVHAPNPVGTHTPWMATCLTCHNGKTAKNGCAICHTNKAVPASHRAANWDIIHPQMQSKINCKQCHAWTANWCRECHTHRPADHGADWRKKHGAQVVSHRSCEACHQADFCIKCHGTLPQVNYNPNLKFVQ